MWTFCNRLALLTVALLLYGCGDIPPSKPPPNPPDLAQCQTQREAKFTYADLGLQKGLGTPAPIAGLAFSPDNTRLLIAFTSSQPDVSGELVHVRTTDWQTESSVGLARLAPRLTRFSTKADRILSASPKPCTTVEFARDTCWDTRGWDTASGQPVNVPNGLNIGLQDLSVSGDGQWLLKIGLGGSLTDFDPQPRGANIPAELIPGGHRELVAGALSKQGDLVALGLVDQAWGSLDDPLNGKFVAGWVRLERWDGKTIEETGWNDERWHIFPDLTAKGAKVDGVPLRLVFDSRDRWLGAQTPNSVYLFEIPNLGRLRATVKFGSTRQGALVFNPSGSLLAGGHLKGITVLSIPELKILIERQGSEVTSVAFSPDDCLLAWGDMAGVVHVINTPSP